MSVAFRVCFETYTAVMLSVLFCTLVATLGCVGAGQLQGPPPDWIGGGGKTPRYMKDRYITGFAMVELGPAQGGIPAAKQQAAASLSRKISVRIQASLRDVSESRDGTDSYAVARGAISVTPLHLDLTSHSLLAAGDLRPVDGFELT